MGTKIFVPKADRHTGAGRGTQRHTQELWRAEERGSPGRGWQIPWLVAPCSDTRRGEARQGLVPLVLLRVPGGQVWLAVLAAQALAPSADGAFGVSGNSHQAQPSVETMSVVILCQKVHV